MSVWNTYGVRKERSGYRDDSLGERISAWGPGFVCNEISQQCLSTSISKRHRNWGFNCPVTNLDCLVCNITGMPVALVDFKAMTFDIQDRPTKNCRRTPEGGSFSAEATVNLANAARISAYNVYYNTSSFYVDPINELAKHQLKKADIEIIASISESRFVKFLYDLRQEEPLPLEIVGGIHQGRQNIACLMLEYNHCQPTAMIDFQGTQDDDTSFNIKAAVNLANASGTAYYIVVYDNNNWSFRVNPMNEQAEQQLKRFGDFETLTSIPEFQFVTFLFKARDQRLPSDVAKKLNIGI